MISIYKNGNYDLFNDFFFLFEFILFFKKIFYGFPLCKTCYIFLFKSVIIGGFAVKPSRTSETTTINTD